MIPVALNGAIITSVVDLIAFVVEILMKTNVAVKTKPVVSAYMTAVAAIAANPVVWGHPLPPVAMRVQVVVQVFRVLIAVIRARLVARVNAVTNAARILVITAAGLMMNVVQVNAVLKVNSAVSAM